MSEVFYIIFDETTLTLAFYLFLGFSSAKLRLQPELVDLKILLSEEIMY